MNDLREKVIYSIERCICHVPDACKDCSKYGGDNAIRCMEELLTDALSLLKAQKPMPVLSQRECETLPNHYERKGFCPKCNQVVEWYLNRSYCGFCGQAVKWDE